MVHVRLPVLSVAKRPVPLSSTRSVALTETDTATSARWKSLLASKMKKSLASIHHIECTLLSVLATAKSTHTISFSSGPSARLKTIAPIHMINLLKLGESSHRVHVKPKRKRKKKTMACKWMLESLNCALAVELSEVKSAAQME